MIQEILISVIVPIYNMEGYVADTLASVQAQSLTNIEVICINDGSTDHSADMIAKICLEDPRVRCVNQENIGLSMARNNGLLQAVGKYVYFLDSDDKIAQECLENLYHLAEADNLDMLLLDGETFFDDAEMEDRFSHYKNMYVRKNLYQGIVSGPELFAEMMLAYDFQPQASLYFYNREFLIEKNLKFPAGILHEDNLFAFWAFMEAKRVSHIEKKYFKRRIRKNSIVTGKVSTKNVWGNYYTATMIIDYLIRKPVVEKVFRAACALAKNRMIDAEQAYQQLAACDKDVFGEYFTCPSQFVLLLTTMEHDFRTLLKKNDSTVKKNIEIERLVSVRDEIYRQLKSLREEVGRKNQWLLEKDQRIGNQDEQIKRKDEQIKRKDEQIKREGAEIRGLNQKWKESEQRAKKREEQLEKELTDLKMSYAYRIGRVIIFVPSKLKAIIMNHRKRTRGN